MAKKYNTQGAFARPVVTETAEQAKRRKEQNTVPGQSLTVKELIALNKRGIARGS